MRTGKSRRGGGRGRNKKLGRKIKKSFGKSYFFPMAMIDLQMARIIGSNVL